MTPAWARNVFSSPCAQNEQTIPLMVIVTFCRPSEANDAIDDVQTNSPSMKATNDRIVMATAPR